MVKRRDKVLGILSVEGVVGEEDGWRWRGKVSRVCFSEDVMSRD